MDIQTIISFDLNDLDQIRPNDHYYVSRDTRVTIQLRYNRESLSWIARRLNILPIRRQLRLRAFIKFDRGAPFPGRQTGAYNSEYFSPETGNKPLVIPILSEIVEQEGEYKFTIGIAIPNGPRYDVDPILIVR